MSVCACPPADESVLVQRRDSNTVSRGGGTRGWRGRKVKPRTPTWTRCPDVISCFWFSETGKKNTLEFCDHVESTFGFADWRALCALCLLSSQDSMPERAQRVPEAEAGCGGRFRSGVCRGVGVRPPLRLLRRGLCVLRLQQAAVSSGQRVSSQLRHCPRWPALPVRGVSEQSDPNHQIPEQRQSAAVHRWDPNKLWWWHISSFLTERSLWSSSNNTVCLYESRINASFFDVTMNERHKLLKKTRLDVKFSIKQFFLVCF